MPLTTPKTFGVGDVLTAADLNTYQRDNVAWLATDKPRCRARNTGNISHTSSGSYQALTFNSERVDVGAMHDTSTNTGRLTVPAGGGGYYAIGGSIEFAANATGRRGIQVRVNGATIIARSEVGSQTGDSTVSVNTQYQLAAADYIELMGLQASGGSLNMLATSAYSPEFWAYWVAT